MWDELVKCIVICIDTCRSTPLISVPPPATSPTDGVLYAVAPILPLPPLPRAGLGRSCPPPTGGQCGGQTRLAVTCFESSLPIPCPSGREPGSLGPLVLAASRAPVWPWP